MFFSFAQQALPRNPVVVICPKNLIRITDNLPRFSIIASKQHEEFMGSVQKNIVNTILDIPLDRVVAGSHIALNYFKYAYHLFDGARVCSHTGRCKDFYSRVGPNLKMIEHRILRPADKKKKKLKGKLPKPREIKKETRQKDTLTFLKSIFLYTYDQRTILIKSLPEIIRWKPEKTINIDMKRFLKLRQEERWNSKNSIIGDYVICCDDKNFGLRFNYSHFIFLTKKDRDVDLTDFIK